MLQQSFMPGVFARARDSEWLLSRVQAEGGGAGGEWATTRELVADSPGVQAVGLIRHRRATRRGQSTDLW
jgi:hypothetical protein